MSALTVARKVLELFLTLPHLLRYLLVGGWNSFFGFCIYAFFYSLWGNRVHYLFLLIPANIFAITNAFLCYKYLVFQTRGHGWAEYWKCYLVYGWMALMSAGSLYLFVEICHFNPILANGFSVVICTIISYFSHKYFSFSHPDRDVEQKKLKLGE